MEDLYLKILEKLSKNGISQETEISDLFLQYKTDPPTKTDEQSDVEYATYIFGQPRRYEICNFLQIMDKNGHLKFEDRSPDLKGTVAWIMPIVFYASITKEGLDYYYNRVLQITTIGNYRKQFYGLIITSVFAFIAALFSVLNYFKSEPKMVELNKNIQVLSKETRGIKLQIDSLRNQ